MGLVWRRPTVVAATAIATTVLYATVAITTAAAYVVPSYLELTSSWKDVNFDTATVSFVRVAVRNITWWYYQPVDTSYILLLYLYSVLTKKLYFVFVLV